MKRDYNDPFYKKARQAARTRDKGTCIWPNCKSKKKVQVHHIQRWVDAPELRYNLDNLCCLCKVHHDLVTTNEVGYAPFLITILMQKKNNG